MSSLPVTSVADVTLREARTSDVGDLALIERDAFSDPWPESAFVEFLERQHVLITVAADRKDRAVGYCVLLVMADEAEIANIAVSEKYRRQRIAGRLLDGAIAAARERGADAIYLEVRKSNTAARRLYESRRFKLVGRRRGYYQNPTEDALVLRWTSVSG